MSDHGTTTLDRSIPADLADAFGTLLGTEDPPMTLEDWADAVVSHFDDSGLAIGAEELCFVDSSRHAARIDGADRHFACVLDPLLVPFVLDVVSVSVRSQSPVSDAVVEMSATRDELTVEPTDAVVSLGVETGVSRPAERADDVAYAYRALCPYLNAFPCRSEYETWADETDGATTMAFPASEAHALARRLGPRLTE